MTTPDTQLSLDAALDGLPAKVRVHDLARRAGIGSKEMISALAGAGVTVGSASSSVDRDIAVAVLTGLLGAADGPGESVGQSLAAGEQSGTAIESPAEGDAPAVTAGDVTDAPVTGELEGLEQPDDGRPRRRRGRGTRGRGRSGADREGAQATADAAGPGTDAAGAGTDVAAVPPAAHAAEAAADTEATAESAEPGTVAAGEQPDGEGGESEDPRRRRRRGRRGRGRGTEPGDQQVSSDDASGEPSRDAPAETADQPGPTASDAESSDLDEAQDGQDGSGEGGSGSSRRRRRRRRGSGSGTDGAAVRDDDPDDTVVHVREPKPRGSLDADVLGVKGSTRLEAKRQRRKDTRESRRRPQILSEAEFLARRESVQRVMAVRQRGDLAQVALLEDGVLVEHFVSRTGSESMIGNVYLGKVQNVLPSMEAAFVDIGRGRNAVLYAGEVNWDMAGLVGKARRIETALSSGDTVLVQVSKDPIGHKGARLTSQVSLPGRFLVYVPGGGATGISRKLPDTERRRLKAILDKIVPEGAGVIIRTAAEGVEEAELVRDVERLRSQWEQIEAAADTKSSAPAQLYAEPGTLIKVIRDLFNSDITSLVVDGDDAWAAVSEYVLSVAPELAERVGRYAGDSDVFAHYRVDEQIAKALERKVHLPSGGSLVIDRTEAMTVIDVNTGKFTGSGGNLEETVTRNNLEAAEEIVRQLRLRDIGGIIVVDFIDMVLESNRELVLRRLTECLGRDRTRHQVAEVTSLGLVQMTRKRMGIGLVEAFSSPCPHCGGRGIVLHDAPVAGSGSAGSGSSGADGETSERRNRRRGRPAHDEPVKVEPLVVERVAPAAKPDPRGPRPPAAFRAEPRADGSDEVAGSASGAGGPEADVATPQVAAESAGVPDADPRDDGSGPPITPGDRQPATGTSSTPDTRAPAEAPQPDTAAPRRRRRAAARPAGAPDAVTEVLDLVIPVSAPRAADKGEPQRAAGVAAVDTTPPSDGTVSTADGTESVAGAESPDGSDGTPGSGGRRPRRAPASRSGGSGRRAPRARATKASTAPPAAAPGD